MTTVKYKKCSLCGLPIEIDGFSLVNGESVLSFCCAGCQSIYQLVYMNAQSIEIDKTTNNNNEEN